MKYLLNVKIEPSKHYIHVKGKIQNAISNTFYLNEKFNILYARADNLDIGFEMDKTAPHPEFDTVSRPVTFNTNFKNIEFEYEGYIPKIIFDVNQINEGIVELAGYTGWYPKPKLNTVFDFEIQLDLPCDYELASNGKIHDNKYISSTGKDNNDIVIFASNKVKRIAFYKGKMKIIFLCPNEMLSSIANRAKDIAKANDYFKEKYGEIKVESAKKEIISAFRPCGGWGYKRGNATFMSGESNKNKTKYTRDFHELSHGWWSIANVITDDWINEGAAEFSAYAASKYIYGSKYAEDLLDNYIEEIKKSNSKISIIHTTSTSPDRYLNHYIKTTVMFIYAVKCFGEERVFALLKALYTENYNVIDLDADKI
ncbi:MAG: hypothetical protein PHX70_11760 [Clostridium sp.]|nr:hypothetical protein [Clostridium sp.]